MTLKEIKAMVTGSDYDIETSDVGDDFELSIGKEPMSEDDFYNKYCAACGTQRCSGINDHIFREGCQFYHKEYK